MQNRQVLFVKRPVGAVTPDVFELLDAAVPEPTDGEVLVRNIYLSCDPYMRGQMGESGYSRGPFELGLPLPARVVGQVEKSRRDGFAEGDYVWGFLAWAHYSCQPADMPLWHVDPAHGPISHGISVLGMPGLTAYAGMLKYGKAQPGETVFVSAASGAVGSVAGQLGRIAGARVVGSAGSDAKVAHMKDVLRFDEAFNYKELDIGTALDKHCPDGIDVYFDNVGGETLDAVLARLNEHARLPICGQISEYDVMNSADQYGIRNFPNLLRKHATVTGFSVRDNMEMFEEFVLRMAALMKSGDVVYTEDIVDGIENAPDAFIGMMRGENIGKRLVRVGEDPTLG
ncbi:MAG: NADP-dependent oxidoreductase [Pseudomonadota bacterium]|nr:NADP-dependent oxidoreductase [Pseudomonadota bacterium]